ncbi:hypothetical protein [Burkholderia ubonensis]|uniref:hypothetical protein n=1 Tax=Burkholderia ubonensis TaxID=101571 RepID=UPI0012F83F50|nr:hypothetical protein [Burkholderia ubonensis]
MKDSNNRTKVRNLRMEIAPRSPKKQNGLPASSEKAAVRARVNRAHHTMRQ